MAEGPVQMCISRELPARQMSAGRHGRYLAEQPQSWWKPGSRAGRLHLGDSPDLSELYPGQARPPGWENAQYSIFPGGCGGLCRDRPASTVHPSSCSHNCPAPHPAVCSPHPLSPTLCVRLLRTSAAVHPYSRVPGSTDRCAGGAEHGARRSPELWTLAPLPPPIP